MNKHVNIWLAALTALSLTACSASAPEETETVGNTGTTEEDSEVMTNDQDGEHVIEVSGKSESYSGITIEKTGNSSGDEADFYGENSAVFASESADLKLDHITVRTAGTHANAVFSYGTGTTVTISNSTIDTSGNCSGGLMTTGGGTMIAENLNVHTTGNSSAAIRSDRGGGTVNVTGGKYVTEGTGSPAIYSTADITVNDAELTSAASQGVVVEGKNSVELNNVTLTADNTTKNSDKSEYFQAVMIYQSMSGDASVGTAEFTMNGGTLVNMNGDIFFVNNTQAEINMSDVRITNISGGVFLRAAAAGWGKSGSNGGHVTLRASGQTFAGDILVDDISSLNLYLTDSSDYSGSINPDGEEGVVYVEIEAGSHWKLREDSYITSLTCQADSIDLNGYKLYVNGEEYTEGTAVEMPASSGSEGMPEGNEPPERPEGQGEPPAKPDGQGIPPEKPEGGEPPAKP
ncbi:MAG: hypothetical protein K6A40_09250 [Solobacterium sp.]|nr:hypothetical protein [Solobacterium sp.]